jgi:N-acetylneuraminic acid mutarotase
VFGGFSDDLLCNEVYKFDLDTQKWLKVSKENPFGDFDLYYHSAIVYQNSMIVFGGFHDNQQKNDLYSFDLITYEWRNITNQLDPNLPTPRYEHGSCLVGQHEMIVIGGRNSNISFKDMYMYNFKKAKWSKIDYFGEPFPQGMISRSLCKHNNFIYCFDRGTASRFDLFRGKWEKIEFPLIDRSQYCVASSHKEMFIFGGFHSSSFNVYCHDSIVFEFPQDPMKQIFDLLEKKRFTDVEIFLDQ